ncbi:MAG: type IIL restriction-modification enzyme MmeI, partial [Limisphaerales bacterium]
KAAEYIQDTRIVVGFVSTNSISQGEQVGALWMSLFQKFHLKIHFGHRTFTWESEARGKAHVHVVIIGFAAFDTALKNIYDYDGEKVVVSTAKNISPYLVEGSDVAVLSRSKPICQVPECEYGNKPTDGGHLIIEEEDRKQFLAENPDAKKYLRPLLCAEEYLYAIPRWCLWLKDASPSEIRNIEGIKKRVEAVRDFRLASKKEPTRRKADEPMLFAEIRQPKSRYIVLPRHSSETRRYIPFGYFNPDVIIHDSCTALADTTPFHFGVISSAMHMAWMRQVCGRLESRYRYSNKLVYNNFPWPQNVSEKQRAAVEEKAQAVLDARAEFMNVGDDVRSLTSPSPKKNQSLVTSTPTKQCTLADLYDPVAMPPRLHKAHEQLDRAVDLCYRKEPFTSDRQRVEYLFQLYEQLTAPLLPATGKKRKNKTN